MKAAVLLENNTPLVVEDVDLAEPKHGEVLVRYVASGVCHTDLSMMQALRPIPLPMILGHEGAGVVERVGPGVTRTKPGDHFIANPEPFCGRCKFCASGRPNICLMRGMPKNLFKMLDNTYRVHRNGDPVHTLLQIGTFAHGAVVPEECVIPIRKDAPLDKVCLIGCGAMSGVGSVFNRAKVAPGSSVAVFGCGGVGLCVVQGAAIAGAGKIIAVDVRKQKLEMAEHFGATHVIDASREDPVSRIQQLTDDLGVDYSFEAVGTAKTVEDAFASVHRGGTCVMIGLPPAGTKITLDVDVIRPERVLMASGFGGARQPIDLPMLVDLYMSGKLKLDELISRTLPLEEVNTALDELQHGQVARSVLKYDA